MYRGDSVVIYKFKSCKTYKISV